MKFEGKNIMKTKIISGDISDAKIKDEILEYSGEGNLDYIICSYAIHYFITNLK
jgi:hypothetical protein